MGERELVYIHFEVMVATRLYVGVNIYGTVRLKRTNCTIKKVYLNTPD